MRSLPLFHRIAGQPVAVLGTGTAADAKRRLVERAGGIVVDDLPSAAHLAFIAVDDEETAHAMAERARAAGLIVNVTDQPNLCDFTVPSLVDRDPVLIAVGTGGASAGLAKALRLRLERLLPARLGELAQALHAARAVIRARWPAADDRRRALDGALEDGGPLDPLRESANVAAWLEAKVHAERGHYTIVLRSDDPDDLTLREARWLGQADVVIAAPDAPPAILARARADALRITPDSPPPDEGIVVELRR